MRKLLILLLAALCLVAAAASAETLVISADITVIGEEAFCDLSAYDEVILPEGLLSIGARAFSGSTIKRVYLPTTLVSIGEDAFMDGTVGYGPAGTWAGDWFNAQENLVYEADYGAPEEADETVWEEVWLEEAWCIYPDGKLHAGDLGALCARWLVWPLEDGDSPVLSISLCQNEEMEISQIRRADIDRFEFYIDTAALPDFTGGSVKVKENLPEGAVSTEDPDEIIDYLVWPSASKKKQQSGGNKSGGGTATVRIVHTKASGQSDHGYDQLGLTDLALGVTTPMTVLTLSGEELPLSLSRDGEEAWFIPALLSWYPEEPTEEDDLNTLLLEAQALPSEEGGGSAADAAAGDPENAPAPFEWTFTGELLRKLDRSGLTWLGLKAGDQILLFPAEGFLSGEAYDALKAAGTASRLFTYDVLMSPLPAEENDPSSPVIKVAVNGDTWLLTPEESAPLYLHDVMVLPGDALEIVIGGGEGNG